MVNGMNLGKFENLSEKEQSKFLEENGIRLPVEGCEFHGTVAIPVDIFFVNGFDAAYKSGTILFHHLSMRWNEGQKKWWACNEPITVSELKKKFFEQTGRDFKIPTETQREIARQQAAHKAEINNRHWKRVFNGNLSSSIVRRVAGKDDGVGRVRIHGTPPEGACNVQIFYGLSKRGKKTIEVVISAPKATAPNYLDHTLVVFETTSYNDTAAGVHSGEYISFKGEIFHDSIHRDGFFCEDWTCHVAVCKEAHLD